MLRTRCEVATSILRTSRMRDCCSAMLSLSMTPSFVAWPHRSMSDTAYRRDLETQRLRRRPRARLTAVVAPNTPKQTVRISPTSCRPLALSTSKATSTPPPVDKAAKATRIIIRSGRPTAWTCDSLLWELASDMFMKALGDVVSGSLCSSSMSRMRLCTPAIMLLCELEDRVRRILHCPSTAGSLAVAWTIVPSEQYKPSEPK
mmetsp:Transcript_97395/g.303711  ORF Transcript_97395/g.303711 Transcript_97395/m.303711 type:complete len:203 (-) Transcript_97395:218-826(-)